MYLSAEAGHRQRVGTRESGGRAAIGLPLERSSANRMGAQHPTGGCPPLFDHFPQPSRTVEGPTPVVGKSDLARARILPTRAAGGQCLSRSREIAACDPLEPTHRVRQGKRHHAPSPKAIQMSSPYSPELAQNSCAIPAVIRMASALMCIPGFSWYHAFGSSPLAGRTDRHADSKAVRWPRHTHIQIDCP